jgi:hypothetical protein
MSKISSPVSTRDSFRTGAAIDLVLERYVEQQFPGLNAYAMRRESNFNWYVDIWSGKHPFDSPHYAVVIDSALIAGKQYETIEKVLLDGVAALVEDLEEYVLKGTDAPILD